MQVNYLSPKAEARHAGDKGEGIYAVASIAPGETVVGFGGWVCDRATLDRLTPHRRKHSIQIDDDLFMVGPDDPEPGDLVNHSCLANAGLVGSVLVVAMRPILPGEEITIDYAMCDSVDYDEFDCACGTPRRRGRVTASDWTRPELQERYAGYFSAYLARRMGSSPAASPPAS